MIVAVRPVPGGHRPGDPAVAATRGREEPVADGTSRNGEESGMPSSRAHGVRIGWIVALVLLGAGLSLAVRRNWDTDPDRVFLRADAAFKAGRFAEADTALRRLERLRPATDVDRFLRAEVERGARTPRGCARRVRGDTRR